MKKFAFNKLVRDKIPDGQRAEGSMPVVRTLSRSEHKQALIDKLHEESTELRKATPEHAAEELADLQQILDDLAALYHVKPADIQKAKQAKLAKSGGFSKGLYVEHIATDHPEWTAYYQSHPDKYPEIKD